MVSGAGLSTCLTIDESKALLALCRAGKLHDAERWIAWGKSIITSPSIKKTPLLTAIDTVFHSLVELVVRNEPGQEQKDRALREGCGKQAYRYGRSARRKRRKSAGPEF